MNREKYISEGWVVGDFINELSPMFNAIMNGNSWHKPFNSHKELKQWCIDNQPYYKKYIPEVYNYFKEEYNKYSK